MKVYNNFYKIARDLEKFFSNIFKFRYHHLHHLVHCLISIIISRSTVTSNFASFFNWSNPYFIQHESIERKIRRFFSAFSAFAYNFFETLISHVIKLYKVKHHNNIIHISIDHMYCRDSYTILLFALRIGKQGIPIWFRCFKGHQPHQAMSLSLVNEGISFCANLFANTNYSVVFLADRWFSFIKIIKHIESLDCQYVFRTKTQFKCSYINSSNQLVQCNIGDIKPRIHSSKYIDINFTGNNFPTTLVVGRSINTDDPWYLLTNISPNCAVSHYSKRFGSIECIFKNQKSNGFNLERSNIKKIENFISLFTIVCIAVVWAVIIGSDYSKNKSKYKTNINDVRKTAR